MSNVRKIISGAVFLLLVLYFTPLIVEGLRPSTEMVRDAESNVKTVTAMGHAASYTEHGGGYPVLLVHGFGESTLVWEKNIPALAAMGYKAYALDLLGHGMSDKPYGYRYRLEAYAGQILEFLDAMKIPHANLIGHSMGGAAVMKFACMFPSRVNRLVLIGSAGLEHGPGSAFISLLRIPLIGEFLLLFNFKPLLRKAITSINFNGRAEVDDEYLGRYAMPAATRGYNYMFLNILRNFNTPLWSVEDCIRGIKAPALIIHGAHDRLIPPRAAERMHSMIPNSAIRIVSDGPHGVMETDAATVNEAILQFFK